MSNRDVNSAGNGRGPEFIAICTELRRKYPRWSERSIEAEAKQIFSKRGLRRGQHQRND